MVLSSLGRGSSGFALDASKSHVARGHIDLLRVARGRPVTAAIVRRAQARAAPSGPSGESGCTAGWDRSLHPPIRRVGFPESSTPSRAPASCFGECQSVVHSQNIVDPREKHVEELFGFANAGQSVADQSTEVSDRAAMQ